MGRYEAETDREETETDREETEAEADREETEGDREETERDREEAERDRAVTPSDRQREIEAETETQKGWGQRDRVDGRERLSPAPPYAADDGCLCLSLSRTIYCCCLLHCLSLSVFLVSSQQQTSPYKR